MGAVTQPTSTTYHDAKLRQVVRAPLTRTSWLEALYCVLAAPLGLFAPLVLYPFVAIGGLVALWGPEAAAPPVFFVAILTLAALATRMARAGGALNRRLASGLLGLSIPPPPRLQSGGMGGWLAVGFRDSYGWRCAGYLLLKIPLIVVMMYAVSYWVTGLINLSTPLWWELFRNQPPDAPLSAWPIITPFSVDGIGHVTEFPGTLFAAAIGAITLLAAPWVSKAVLWADRGLIGALLAPVPLAERVRDLEASRANAVEDSAALLRRVERDLHDGTQIRLAALAMNLGLAKQKLAAREGDVDAGELRELVDGAHAGAKDALAELRRLVRGIHPPVLDNGLADALAGLAEASAIPVEVSAALPERPSPAIETITYFCAAELLANAAKHSRANRIAIEVVEEGAKLVLTVTDDGVGGAAATPEGGLAGLAQRVRTVDGGMDVDSPPGGPTRVTLRLPLHA
jgi:signal transduction histidine kinase